MCVALGSPLLPTQVAPLGERAAPQDAGRGLAGVMPRASTPGHQQAVALWLPQPYVEVWEAADSRVMSPSPSWPGPPTGTPRSQVPPVGP